MAEFSFGQVEAVLAVLNLIAEHKRAAFVSRLKHLQKNGLPVRDRPGRGKIGSYSFDQLMQVATGVELLQAGLPPQVAARLVVNNWITIRHLVLLAVDSIGSESSLSSDWLLMATPRMLRDLTGDDHLGAEADEVFYPVPTNEALVWLRDDEAARKRGPAWRTLVINATSLSLAVIEIITSRFKFTAVGDLKDDLLDAVETEHQFMLEYVARTDDGEYKIKDPAERAALWRKIEPLTKIDYASNPPRSAAEIKMRAREIVAHQISAKGMVELSRLYFGGRDEASVDQEAWDELLELGLVQPPCELGIRVTVYGAAVVREGVRRGV